MVKLNKSTRVAQEESYEGAELAEGINDKNKGLAL